MVIPHANAATDTFCGVLAADAVVHTAFFHTGDYEEATRLDIAAIGAMTDAMAGSGKPFIMSSATGVLGDTGALTVSEEFPLNPHHCIKPPGTRVICQRVSNKIPEAVLALVPQTEKLKV